jgi:protein MpaA
MMRRWVGLAVTLCVFASACGRADTDAHAMPRSTPSRRRSTTSVTTLVRRRVQITRVILGRSVQGRPITAVHLLGAAAAAAAARRVVVFGCIHGNETAGIAVTQRLEHLPPPAALDLWIVDNVNPDGAAARTRDNADGVDLNRNFPYAWQPLGHPGVEEYSGARPLSEPESRIIAGFLTRVRPDVTIWFHQHQHLVDLSGGDPSIERRYARLVGLPFQELTRYPGSVASWQNATLRPTTAFVVELAAGTLTAPDADRYVRAVSQLLPSAPAG